MVTGFFAAAAEVPRKATDFAIQTGPGKYIWVNDFSGKTVVLGFILTTCPHCQFTTGILNRIHKDYADKGVVVLESAIEPMSSLHVPDFLKKFGVSFPVGYDEQNYAGKFLGKAENEPMMMPQVVLIDPSGTIRAQYAGDDLTFTEGIQETTLRDALNEIIKKQAASKPPARKAP
ncbi:MAG TPA: TlpA disulfide reductase family protein [Bryobacteraceae bacterium]|nr:TlpA disulfide reductase family protein [Bryobacteraceae bacterium]